MPKTRVLIDATALPRDRGGVGRYVEGLLDGLSELHQSPIVVCQADDYNVFERRYPEAEIVPLPRMFSSRPARLVWEQVGLPGVARRAKASVVHSPHYTMPLLGRFRRVVTIHDATFFSDPSVHSGLKARFFRTWTRLALRRAQAVIVPSTATERELRRFVRQPKARVHVAHHGVDGTTFHFPTQDEVESVGDLLDLRGRDYIAFLGTLEPRKNIPALIRAVDIAAVGSEDICLVLAGSDGWDDSIEEAVKLARIDVLKPGYLPIETLSAFMNRSRAFVYPSLGEGFGLPVLEAMASGAVVITTRRLALPEVGGDAVLYSDVDSGSIASAITGVLADDGRAAELRERANRRATTFTWAACARNHLLAYEAGAS